MFGPQKGGLFLSFGIFLLVKTLISVAVHIRFSWLPGPGLVMIATYTGSSQPEGHNPPMALILYILNTKYLCYDL